MSTRVFRTRRGRITLTVESLIYEHKYDRPWRVSHRLYSLARTHITEIQLVNHVHLFTPTWTEVRVLHRGSVLTISHVGRRTAEALKKALGF
jgi:hypothetical protein